MNKDIYFEELRDEFVNEYCATHGGNFTKVIIADAFEAGYNNEEAPKGYHAFVAWQVGQKHGGHKL